jgi:hypothetical protein
MHSSPRDSTAEPLSHLQEANVQRTLDRVLASPAFRKSEQCQRFLRYVVEHSHKGEDERLRERIIGIEVFGRQPDYDTAEDPVVRVRATEVRKRLAQYYVESGTEEDVRFEIPSGSYRAEFHWPVPKPPPGEPAATAKPAKSGSRWTFPALAAMTVVGLLIALLVLRTLAPPSVLDQFWAPVLESGKPVLLYCGQPVVYFLSRDVHEKYRVTLPPEKQRGAYVITLDPKETIRGSDVIPVTDQFVGIGNAHTAVLLSTLFAGRQKAVEIRYANDLSFSDLRSSPSVLIGAFSNFWTLEMQGQLRFVFEQIEGVRRIRDRSNNRTWQLTRLAPDGKTPEDYAVVSRLFDSATGQLLISAAGITQYGTRAAGELLTQAPLLKEALANAPADWPRKNLQVLLHTTIYKGTPAPPKVVATHIW